MENTMTININIEDYIEMLEDRRDFCDSHFGWNMPDCVWDYMIDFIRDCGAPANPNPKYVVDNLLVNSDYCHYDDAREYIELDNGKIIYETDKQLEKRLANDAMAFVQDETDKYVIFSL